ncbi:hypothetical protein LWI29_000013 [Acer saccharum]|uniref:CCHC-type domain-containing protein n=1 Tax=Acer saccharum TaxID=4024 RepID=A0AA39W6A1_ACESA|nr:hypothetical protein LWI29_000013 [Acer saccharum]
MNINEKIGGTSKSTYDFNTTSSSQWEYTNRQHNKYTYCGNSYNTDDEDATVDPSFMTDRTPSTQHLCTPDNTATIEVEPTFSELDDPAKLSSLQPSDVIGKEFASVQDAEAFYKNYSLFVGFSIRKDEMRRDRHGMITIRKWVCSKQGYRDQKYIDKTDKKREPRGQTREGCHAAMKIKIDRRSMMWVAKEFVIEHTHSLSPPNHIQFLRSHRTVNDSEVAQLQSWRTVGVKTSQVMDHLVDQSGSYSNMGHTKKDLQNRFDSVRRFEIQTSDADSVISYLTAKSEMDPQFFFNYTLDEEDHFGNLFWADSTSRSDYAFFGDVLAFDATYRTNVYRRPLVMLVGVNHHHSTTIFGFGLLGDETVETYTWLLQTFLVAMHGKMPKSVVTDGDKAMHKAIKTVMPESVRRLCCWHVERNVQTNVQDGNFTRAFCNCMLNFMTEDDFDLQWFSMVEKFGLNNNEWVSAMYAKRKEWAETYLRDSLFGGMRSTQCCESMNSYLNRFVHYRLKMYEFLKNIDRALDRIRNTETFNDYQCSTTTPVYNTHLLGLEKHAAEKYTRNVFFLVREEIREEASLSIVNCVQDVDNYTYTFKKFGNANRIWTTRFIPSVNHIHRSCKLFEIAGLPCSHSFSVMKAMDMQHIPSSVILDRWTTRAKDFSDIKYSSEATPTLVMEKARYGSLSSKCSKMCYFASKSNDGFKEANGEIDKLTLHMQHLMPSSPIHSQNMAGVSHVHHVKDPSTAATKGSVQRKKNAGVKQRKCGKCGQPGHTAKTCHANVQTNNSTASSNAVHMYKTNLTQNNDTSYGSPSTGPSYSFTFPVNDDCGGDTKHDVERGKTSFNPSTSTFEMHGYHWWGTTER